MSDSLVGRGLYYYTGTWAGRPSTGTGSAAGLLPGHRAFFTDLNNAKGEWNGTEWVITESGGAALTAELMEPTGTGGKRTMTSTSQQTAAITADAVDISADVDCWIEFGADPTAVEDTSYRLVGDTTYRFRFTSGDKIAAKVTASTGNLWYKPVA